MCWFAALGAAMGASTAAGTGMLGMSAATAAGLSATMQVAGLAFSAYSAMNQSQATQDAANYNAAVARNNAQVAEWQANDAVERGNKAVQDHMRKAAALKGTQTASMAARGLDLSEGTPLNILTDTDLFAEIDSNTIKNNAAREAWGYRAQASNSRATGGLYDMQAGNQNPMLAGAGTLLSGAGSVAEKWYQYRKVS